MDYEWRLRELAKLVVPEFGDWCAVDVLHTDGTFARLAVVHSDPDKIRFAREVESEYPEDPESPTSRANILKSGVPFHIGKITREMIDQGARDARHAELIHSLGIRSYLTVPLIARGNPLGTLTVVMAESGREYDETDIEFVSELGQRAAVAIENARLHTDLQAKNSQLEEQAVQLQQLLEEQQMMNESLTEQTVEMELAQEALREAAHELEIKANELVDANSELSDAEASYRFLADTIPVQVWTAMPDGSLDYVSKRTAAFFARTDEEILGEGWISVVHPDDKEQAVAAWTGALEHGSPYETEIRLWSARDDEWVWHLVRALPLRDEEGKIIRWFGSNTNIDVQRRASEEHERLKQEAQVANRAKMEFLAAMSHELRTPLNAISGYADLLLMEIPGPLTKDQQDYISRMHRSGKFLLGLINDVLNFAKIDAGAVEVKKEPVDLRSMLDQLHALVEPQLNARRQTYSFDSTSDECTVLGDKDKIEQVVLNLLTNASKFTDDGGTIKLDYECIDEVASITVSDNGRGIPADRLNSIFDPFVQVERSANSSSQQGVGLGLAISRELARAMNGDITVVSVAGKGSTFTLRLPRFTADSAD